jgi:putative transcriptional regulator
MPVNNVKLLRVQYDMKAKELAEAVGLSRYQLSRIERGHMVPDVYQGQKIARVFRTTVEEVFPMLEPAPQ